jgi:hypothetical protein
LGHSQRLIRALVHSWTHFPGCRVRTSEALSDTIASAERRAAQPTSAAVASGSATATIPDFALETKTKTKQAAHVKTCSARAPYAFLLRDPSADRVV